MLPLCGMYIVVVCIVSGRIVRVCNVVVVKFRRLGDTERVASSSIGESVKLGYRLGCRATLSSGDHCLGLSLTYLVLVVVFGPFACIVFLGFLGGSLALRGIFQKIFVAREDEAFREVIVLKFQIVAL